MMEGVLHGLSLAGLGLAHVLLWLLCLGAVALSCISLSGTWLVLLAGLGALCIFGTPGWTFIWVALLVSIGVELMEWGASAWGIRRRGGSGAAGWAALLGAMAGMFLGALIPPPLVGSLLGMLGGSFLLAFLVERRRMAHGEAAHIAMGAVAARILILLVKILTTLGLALALLAAIYFE